MATLYLIDAHARRPYTCDGCFARIPQGALYFRHDPHPQARRHRNEKARHLCLECVPDATEMHRDPYTRRLFYPAEYLLADEMSASEIVDAIHVETVGIGRLLAQKLESDTSLIYRLTPDDFEELICDRLSAMGLECRRVGSVFQKDGGIDIVFWTPTGTFPFLGAAQVKHHRNPARREGSPTVRDFAGAIAGHQFGAGLIVTNTSFSPDAQWFARERSNLIRLRDLRDVRRWIGGNFASELEWREIPASIEVCPGVHVPIR